MSELKGLEWTASDAKVAIDERVGRLLGPPAAVVEHLAGIAISRHFDPGTDPLFFHLRHGADGNEFLLPKLRTMDGDDPVDVLSLSKDNPRIVSLGARLVRDLRMDELPQIPMLGQQLSVVGPRSQHPKYLEHYLWLAAKKDKGLARDYEELYFNPDVRHGLTGPLQLNWAWDNEREVDRVASGFRADLDYYPEKASALGDCKIIAMTPSVLAASSIWNHMPIRFHNLQRCKKQSVNEAIESQGAAAALESDEEAV